MQFNINVLLASMLLLRHAGAAPVDISAVLAGRGEDCEGEYNNSDKGVKAEAEKLLCEEGNGLAAQGEGYSSIFKRRTEALK